VILLPAGECVASPHRFLFLDRLHLVAFDAQGSRQSLAVFTIRPFCGRLIRRYDPFFMGVMTGNTGHLPVLRQRKDDIVRRLHIRHMLEPLGRRRLGHMVEITRVVAFNGMASPAQGARVPDECDVFVSRGFFIRLFCVAIQTHLGIERSIGLDLVMGVQLLVLFPGMAAVTEIRFPWVGCAAQSIAVEQALLALPIDIVAGVAGEFPVCQREVGRNGDFFVILRINVQRMAIAGRHAVMTPAEQLVVAVVFQITIASLDRCSFMALTAILSGKVDVGLLSDDCGLSCWRCRFRRFLLRH